MAGRDLPPLEAWLRDPPGRPTVSLPVRGVNLVGFSSAEYASSSLQSSLAEFAGLGGNWVAINFWWFQDGPSSTEIAPDFSRYSITDAAIAGAVAAAGSQNLRVLLRPMVDLRNGRWRGIIRPSAGWFAAYADYVRRYAELAMRWGVEAFSVGVELQRTERDATAWRGLVDNVRAVFPGLVVYCANHSSADRVSWWDAVDVIGVDAYYAVALGPGMGAAEMSCAWQYWLEALDQELTRQGLRKPVWLTEVGVRASRGAARLPWCFAGRCLRQLGPATLDLTEQANYYDALLRVVGTCLSITGLFWWLWYPDPHAAYVADDDYSPQGKPAEDVLREFWSRGALDTR